jgi:glucan endo-1,3-beta-D-glucosidase
MRSSTLLALAAFLSSSSATVLQGFNYGSTRSDGSVQTQADFQALFSTAKAVSSGFTSARLYTMIVRQRESSGHLFESS